MADTTVQETWNRYIYIRDTGHARAVEKMTLCDDFFLGDQWPQADIDRLNAEKRPALTINKTLSRLAAVFGEQIRTQAEIGFKPMHKGPEGSAELMTRVWLAIANANQYRWKRSEVFCDGAIGSRGFYDLRLSFDSNIYGDVVLEKDDAKSVMIDPDANGYDPDSWHDVMRSKWYSYSDVQLMYGTELADKMKSLSSTEYPWEYDALVRFRDRFRDNQRVVVPTGTGWGYYEDSDEAVAFIRVIERQVKEPADMEYFVDPMSGSLMCVPFSWDRNRIAHVVQSRRWAVIRRKGERIRWVQVCGPELVKDEWSPYKHFTTIPYFPFFRNGRATGLVEHLIGPQVLLNKSLSQELHIVNTSANSGWKVKQNSIKNMSIEELEQRGAETGLIIELDDVSNAEKIQPNNIPQGMDRLASKAEGFFGPVSGVPDAMVGMERSPEMPAKAQMAASMRGALNLAKPLENLERTDFMLARNVLDIVQEFYTEERVFRVKTDPYAEDAEEIRVNFQGDSGEILNDLTEGKYDIEATSRPTQETFEESQFDEAVVMRKELGIAIPDEVLIANSKLANKREILANMKKAPPPPELQKRIEKMDADIKKVYAEVDRINADALRKRTSAVEGTVKASKEAQAPPEGEEPEEEPDYTAAATNLLNRRGVAPNAAQ